MALSDYQTLVDSMVRDNAQVIKPGERDKAITMALVSYSQDVPRRVVEDITWAAAGVTAALPALWGPASTIVSAEYPLGQRPATLIDLQLYHEPMVSKLITTDRLPAGAIVRVTYTAAHALAETAAAATIDTIPLMHREGVASYAAYLLCRQLAAHYSAERDSSISADSSNTESRARNYAIRANEYRTAYYVGIGRADPFAKSGGGGVGGGAGSGGDAAAGVTNWQSRVRFSPHLNNDDGYL